VRPRLLDLCCGVGGATVGYQRAGFDVTGVDLADQPDYPGEFVLGDAVDYGRRHGHRFDAIHASPPCQRHSALTKGTNKGRRYVDLIPAIRALLDDSGRPYVIENVVGSPLRRDVILCGEMFGLDVIRHRVFELGRWSVGQPTHIAHRGRVGGMRHGVWHVGPYVAVYGEGGGKGSVDRWREAMGIDWTRQRKSIAEAIPPAYTHWLGGRLSDAVRRAA
jgi:DNA (cytosine-5)-methyltransferase 1